MSNLALLITVVLCLTVAGMLTLWIMVKKYYWGVRGTPPPPREERRRLREEEERARGIRK
jgi:hypothetical protein